jgi:GTPase
VGVEFRTRGRADVRTGHAGKTGSAGITPGAQAARDHATSVAASSSPLPAGSRDFSSDFTSEDALDELRALATSAGAEIAGEFTQRKDRPDPATLIGKGKLEEIAGASASVAADVILFDHDLSPSQQRNIEGVVHTRVIDRTQLILDIFARHARTREGQLQVELAQLEYMLPRLAGRGVEMSQLGGGIGTRGPGETQLETDRRKIYRRVRHVKQQIENVRRIRAQQRQRRESVPVATVALVGYTNAGKSTLFNALTQSNVVASSRMFATLDPTIRGAELPSKRKVLFSDTVGFIRHLPHTLVSAFRATLEEVQRATLIIQVSDASSPVSGEQDVQVESVLKELEADKKPRLRVMNKIDLLPPKQRESLRDTGPRDNDATIHISAAKGIGLSTLLDRVDALLEEDRPRRVRLRVPQKEGKLLAQLQAGARIYSRQYQDGLVELEAEAPASLLRRMREWVVE